MAKFIPYTFTKKDVIGNFINDKQYENWIAGQVRSKKVVKVRNGLYVQVDVSGYAKTESMARFNGKGIYITKE